MVLRNTPNPAEVLEDFGTFLPAVDSLSKQIVDCTASLPPEEVVSEKYQLAVDFNFKHGMLFSVSRSGNRCDRKKILHLEHWLDFP